MPPLFFVRAKPATTRCSFRKFLASWGLTPTRSVSEGCRETSLTLRVSAWAANLRNEHLVTPRDNPK